MKDIKETKELLEGIKLLAISGAKIAKDGIQISDLVHLVDLAKNFEDLKKAYEGMSEIDEEIKDLQEAELMELGVLLFRMLKEVKSEL